jgi:GNAT superfamily N-acetyltransferase
VTRARRERPAGAAWRHATAEDAGALRDLERVANLAALGHVFPPQEYPFPDEEVLERWRATLAEPAVTVEVLDGPGLRGYAAYDATTLRHLAVHPDAWGTGLARAGVDRAVAGIAASGAERALLWCLEANTRALGLYRHLGWRRTGKRRPAEWPPYPVEAQLDLPIWPS